jgi:hypothetical protein
LVHCLISILIGVMSEPYPVLFQPEVPCSTMG